jgi:hypothetical protein
MSRTTFALLPPLAALALLSPGEAAAGPPEGASGKMVLDKVADGLRTYQREKDICKAAELLQKLAATRDVRVAVALGDFVENFINAQPMLSPQQENPALIAAVALRRYCPDPDDTLVEVMRWWDKHKADLRRRAAQLPR